MFRVLPFLICLVGVTSTTLSQSLVITEIMYNSPGEDLEFLEFYNNSNEAIDMSGYSVVEGVSYEFRAMSLGAGEVLVMTNDSLKFQRFYNISALQWSSGSLNNGGEEIAVINSSQDTIISFEYSDNEPWSKIADGGGASLVLCDADADMSDPANWERSQDYFRHEEGVWVYADPGTYVGCDRQGEINLDHAGTQFVTEKEGMVAVEFFMDNPLDREMVFIPFFLSPNNEAEQGVDFNFLTDTIRFKADINSSEIFELEIIDDGDIEQVESLEFELISISDSTILTSKPVTIGIIDNDSEPTMNLQLRGVVHSSSIKAIELVALEDIRVSQSLQFGLGSANNGGGSDSQEYWIVGEINAGECVFVTNDTIRFKHFFGDIDNRLLIQDEELDVDYNGNDAIELYENCQVIDVFGRIDEDGTGTEWDYNQGWAKRKASVPSSLSFEAEDWEYSGTGVLDGVTSNDDASDPYPLTCALPVSSTLELTQPIICIYPNPSDGFLQLTSDRPVQSLQILDVYGKMLKSVPGPQQNQMMDLQELQSGIYFVQLIIDGQKSVRKILLD